MLQLNKMSNLTTSKPLIKIHDKPFKYLEIKVWFQNIFSEYLEIKMRLQNNFSEYLRVKL